jgi:hypothetical protein
VHKEDIWLSRIPLPLKTTIEKAPAYDFQQYTPGGWIKDWNIYSPGWAPIEIVREASNSSNLCLELRDSDPYDYARAKCIFLPDSIISVSLKIRPGQDNARLEIELEDGYGRRPARLVFSETGQLHTTGGDFSKSLGQYKPGEWHNITMNCSQVDNTFELVLNGSVKARMKLAEFTAGPFQVLSLRTGTWRGAMIEEFRWNRGVLQSESNRGPVETGTDIPIADPAVFLVDDVEIRPGL